MDADAGGELEAASGVQTTIEITERLLDLPGGAHDTVRGILVRHGRAEKRHHAVAGQLIDDTFEAVDLVKGQLQVLIEEVPIFFRIEALGDRRGADEITEEDRHQLPLARDRSLNVADLVREILGNVAGETVEA